MKFSFLALAAGTAAALASASPAAADASGYTNYLFWIPPNFTGAPVHGDEPGIGLPMPGAKDAELTAHMLWNMRAGLNVAALQCQFQPTLATVRNYNTILNQHSSELTSAYTTISAYFKRTAGKGWQKALDQYTTRTYNGFSTLHAQLGFCDTAGSIGRAALGQPRGKLKEIATGRMREFRNSLVPTGDRLFIFSVAPLPARTLPPLGEDCWDSKNRLRRKCEPLLAGWPA